MAPMQNEAILSVHALEVSQEDETIRMIGQHQNTQLLI